MFKKSTLVICMAALLCGLLVLSASAAGAQSATATAVNGAETPDYSLNIELTVTDGAVTGITLYDATGAALLTNEDLGDTTPAEALSALLAQMDAAGYLATEDSDPYLLITTSGGILDWDLAKTLKTLASDYISTAGLEYEVDSAALGADVSAKAATLGLPGGRYKMMAYIAEEQGITVEEAIALYGGESVQTLMRTFTGLRAALGNGAEDEDGDESNGNGYGSGLENEEKTKEQLELEAQEREERQDQKAEEQQEKKDQKTSNGNSGSSNGSSNSNSSNGKSNGKK